MDLYYEDITVHSKKIRCGCYALNPDFAKQYPNKVVMVPLKSSEYQIEIVNSIANVTLNQTYENPTNKFLQLQYSFPINPNACVYRFVAQFGKTWIEGVVKEKEEAKIQYKEAIKQGKQAAYGQLNAQSNNFYITFKGQLDSKAKIEFQYEDSLNKMPYESAIEIDPFSENHSFIDRMGSFKKIRLMQQSHKSNSKMQELMYYVKVVDKKAEIIKQSVKHQILSEFTAFICVQKQLIDGKYQQIKDTGKVKVQIINPPPVQYQQRPRANRGAKAFNPNPVKWSMGMKCSAPNVELRRKQMQEQIKTKISTIHQKIRNERRKTLLERISIMQKTKNQKKTISQLRN